MIYFSFSFLCWIRGCISLKAQYLQKELQQKFYPYHLRHEEEWGEVGNIPPSLLHKPNAQMSANVLHSLGAKETVHDLCLANRILPPLISLVLGHSIWLLSPLSAIRKHLFRTQHHWIQTPHRLWKQKGHCCLSSKVTPSNFFLVQLRESLLCNP